MSRVPWKNGKVISVETRDGVFVLAQMLISPYLIFFNVFNDSHKWSDIDLSSVPVLYTAAVTSQLISRSSVKYQKQIKPVTIPQPKFWVHPNSESVYRTIWTGTSIEMTVCYQGHKGCALVRQDLTGGFNSCPYINQMTKGELPYCSYGEAKKYELTTLRAFPYENERLLLCQKLNKNVDPQKELMFGLPLPHIYERYMRLLQIPADVLEEATQKGLVKVDIPD